MTKAIFIVGLPGSGKTYYAHQFANEIDAALFDDFKANAINDSSHFPFAETYVELINELRSGKIPSLAILISVRQKREVKLVIVLND